MKIVLQQVSNVKGSVKRPLLAQDAALSLASIQTYTDGLIYTDMWRDGIDTLLTRTNRNKSGNSIGYSPHNFGISVDLDVPTILDQKKILYEDIIWLMKRKGWYCFRRDGSQNQVGSGHFDFLGDEAEKYLAKSSQDPATWSTVAEMRIWERHSQSFNIGTKEVQEMLAKLGFYHGPFTGQRDFYTREAILAFQRAWDLVQTGSPDMVLCRALAFISAEISILS
jgi:hypothetical protein